MISYQNIKNKSQWKSTIGLSEEKFCYLARIFGEVFESEFGISISEKAKNLNKDFIFSTYKDCLFFTLFSIRNNLVFETLGFIFGIDSGLAQKNLKRFLPILQKVLLQNGFLPKTEFNNIEEFTSYISAQKELIIDVTEFTVQRPKDNEKQKEMYSGKKKRHTVKKLVIATKDKRIFFLGKIYPGKVHDFNILQKEFSTSTNWFEKLIVMIDLGFQGFQDKYQSLKNIIPFKKKRGKKGEISSLTDAEKDYNKLLGKERVKVEHSIGGMKTFRLISERIRIKKTSLIDSITTICAGLWNFNLNFTIL